MINVARIERAQPRRARMRPRGDGATRGGVGDEEAVGREREGREMKPKGKKAAQPHKRIGSLSHAFAGRQAYECAGRAVRPGIQSERERGRKIQCSQGAFCVTVRAVPEPYMTRMPSERTSPLPRANRLGDSGDLGERGHRPPRGVAWRFAWMRATAAAETRRRPPRRARWRGYARRRRAIARMRRRLSFRRRRHHPSHIRPAGAQHDGMQMREASLSCPTSLPPSILAIQ